MAGHAGGGGGSTARAAPLTLRVLAPVAHFGARRREHARRAGRGEQQRGEQRQQRDGRVAPQRAAGALGGKLSVVLCLGGGGGAS